MPVDCTMCKHYFKPERGKLSPACPAFPDGVPFIIISGEMWHDHLFGTEVEKVFFELKKKEAA